MSPNFQIHTPYKDDENNFKMAKAMSYDLSGDFINYSPHVEGRVQACLIGDPDLVEFELEESNVEEEEEESEEEPNADEAETITSDSSSEEDKWNLAGPAEPIASSSNNFKQKSDRSSQVVD